MAKLDRLKEDIGYLKLWLGMIVVTEIGLIGWTATHYGSAKNLLIILAVNAIMGLAWVILVMNREIKIAIKRLGDL